MHRLVVASLAAAGLSVGLGTAASAADLGTRPAPVYTKAPIAAPYYSWTGFYIGGNAGYAWGTSDADTAVPGLPFTAVADQYSAAASSELRPKGFTGGGQIGYNWQWSRSVWGLEADFDSFHLTDSAVGTVTPPGNSTLTSSTSFSTDWLLTARGRVGFLATDRALIYGTGGLAAANLKYSQTNFFAPCAGPGLACVETGALSTTKTGWTAGAGIEYALTNNWSVKAEYLYVDLGSVSTSATSTATGAAGTLPFLHSVDLKANIARGGINYKF
jgi:outer membrane immunogenic protein